MDYTIKHITAERDLDAALVFDKSVFGMRDEHGHNEYTREKWLARMQTHGDLMLYAETDGEIIGIVFGRMENNGSVTVGPVATFERYRGHGIATALILELEERAKAHGATGLALGAVESAEGFYKKLGYTGSLLIQSDKHTVDELLSLETVYSVIWTNIYDGTIAQVCLALTQPDRALQHEYKNIFTGCWTQMVFGKTLQ
jgi:GNAT superfamily N-acetyltransferase